MNKSPIITTLASSSTHGGSLNSKSLNSLSGGKPMMTTTQNGANINTSLSSSSNQVPTYTSNGRGFYQRPPHISTSISKTTTTTMTPTTVIGGARGQMIRTSIPTPSLSSSRSSSISSSSLPSSSLPKAKSAPCNPLPPTQYSSSSIIQTASQVPSNSGKGGDGDFDDFFSPDDFLEIDRVIQSVQSNRPPPSVTLPSSLSSSSVSPSSSSSLVSSALIQRIQTKPLPNNPLPTARSPPLPSSSSSAQGALPLQQGGRGCGIGIGSGGGRGTLGVQQRFSVQHEQFPEPEEVMNFSEAGSSFGRLSSLIPPPFPSPSSSSSSALSSSSGLSLTSSKYGKLGGTTTSSVSIYSSSPASPPKPHPPSTSSLVNTRPIMTSIPPTASSSSSSSNSSSHSLPINTRSIMTSIPPTPSSSSTLSFSHPPTKPLMLKTSTLPTPPSSLSTPPNPFTYRPGGTSPSPSSPVKSFYTTPIPLSRPFPGNGLPLARTNPSGPAPLALPTLPPGCSIPDMIELALVSRERFSIAPCYESMRTFFESFPELETDEVNTLWTLPLTRYYELVRALTISGAKLSPLPKPVTTAFLDHPHKHDTPVDLSRIPNQLLSILLPFQRDGVMFGLRRGGRVLIGDEMGLGKTLQALALASFYRGEWPVVVVCPSSLRVQWAEQFEKWIPDLAPDDIRVIMTAKTEPDCLVNIVSYDLVGRMMKSFNARPRPFQVVIADESHLIKDRKAKRAQAVVPLIMNAKRAILLSGTPAISRPVELWTQLNALDKGLFQRFQDFGMRYCAGFSGRWGMDYTGASNLTELHLLLGETLMIRRMKAEVLHQLPEKRRQQVFLQLKDSETRVMKKVLADLRASRQEAHAFDKDIAWNARKDGKSLLLEAFADTGGLKLPAVCEYVTELLERDETVKLLVFGHHKIVIEGICRILEKQRLDHIRIDGTTRPMHRQDLVDRYQSTPSCRVAVLSITAAGCGLTLTAATCVIFAELFWNPGHLRQAEDRAHRIGQRQSVNIHYLLARDTIDELLWDLIQTKLEVLGQTLDGEEDELKVAQVEELDEIGEEKSIAREDPFIDEVLKNVANYEERKKERLAKRQKNLLGFVQPTEENDDVGTGKGRGRGAGKGGGITQAGRGKRKNVTSTCEGIGKRKQKQKMVDHTSFREPEEEEGDFFHEEEELLRAKKKRKQAKWIEDDDEEGTERNGREEEEEAAAREGGSRGRLLPRTSSKISVDAGADVFLESDEEVGEPFAKSPPSSRTYSSSFSSSTSSRFSSTASSPSPPSISASSTRTQQSPLTGTIGSGLAKLAGFRFKASNDPGTPTK